MANRTKKHNDFVSGQIGDKQVTALPGVGSVIGKQFNSAGITKANQVYEQYLAVGQDRTRFTQWMKETCPSANAKFANDCFDGLNEMHNNSYKSSPSTVDYGYRSQFTSNRSYSETPVRITSQSKAVQPSMSSYNEPIPCIDLGPLLPMVSHDGVKQFTSEMSSDSTSPQPKAMEPSKSAEHQSLPDNESDQINSKVNHTSGDPDQVATLLAVINILTTDIESLKSQLANALKENRRLKKKLGKEEEIDFEE